MALRFETLRGSALHPWLPALARLRIAVFREWPYLYEGDEAHEARYLRTYAEGPDAAAFVAFDADRPVGAATCEPMAETHASVRGAFVQAGLDPAQYCYFGESILLPAYRGQGAGVRFFELREAHARALGLPRTTFCAVHRAPTDPRRPPGYTPLDSFWRKRGYQPCPGLSCSMTWREVGAGAETPQVLDFWERILP
jgi:GNAT superfamily N-acetyltransferase